MIKKEKINIAYCRKTDKMDITTECSNDTLELAITYLLKIYHKETGRSINDLCSSINHDTSNISKSQLIYGKLQ